MDLCEINPKDLGNVPSGTSVYSSSLWPAPTRLSSPLLPTSLPSVKFTSPRSCALPQFSLLLLLCSPYALMPPLPSSEKRGEMIQAPGMRGRAAAGHCTCSATKTSWRLHVQSRHVDVCARIYLIHQTPTLSFWQPPSSPRSSFPAIFTSLPFIFFLFPHFCSHTSGNRQIIKSVLDVWRGAVDSVMAPWVSKLQPRMNELYGNL